MSELGALARRIREELANLERVAGAWHKAERSRDDYYVDAVALNLHSFYNGVVRLLELVAVDIDGRKPGGDAWHRTLLTQMGQEMVGIRPAVLSTSTISRLDAYRAFRHLVRNVYSYNLDPEKVGRLVTDLALALSAVQAELGSFADFLDSASS